MTSSPASPTQSGSSSLRSTLRRGWIPVLVGVIVGVAAAAIVTVLAHKRYTATTRVLVTSTGVASTTQSPTSSAPNMDTEAQLVTSAAVIQAASEAYTPLSREPFHTVVTDIAVAVPPNTTVLQIAFTDDTPALAQGGANALASAYLSDRQSTAQGALDAEIASAKDSVATFTTQLQSLSAQAAAAKGGGSQKSLLLSKIGLVKSQITAVNQQLATLNNIQVTPGRVFTAANLPLHPSSPSKVINLASGLGIGLLLGLLVAWLRIRFRRTVRTEDDLVRVVDAPCIAVLPESHAGDAKSPQSAANYRRVALIAASAVTEPAVVVVSAPLLSTSGSRLAAGVATSLAHSGTTAALLQVHELDVGRPRGVSTTRVRQADDLVSDTGESIPQALERIRGRHSIVVVDVPGATLDADAQTIAAHADAVLLVVDSGTPTKIVREAINGFDSVGAPILGTALISRGKVSRDRSAEDLAALHGSGKRPDRVSHRAPAEQANGHTPDDADPAATFRTRAR